MPTKKASRRPKTRRKLRSKPKHTRRQVRRFRKARTKPNSLFPTALVAIGLLLIGLWGTHRFLYNRSISLSDALLSSYAQETKQTALPIHIVIGEKISLPVVEAGKIEGEWTVSKTSANRVHESALPGEGGNIIIYGHNLNTIFGYLVDVKVGEIVRIRMTNGAEFTYQVTETHIVSPTLYTCTGLLDSKRFVVRALPLEAKD
jgi:LPXTG-site transpeptidase (sortase) family protein